MKTDFKSLTSLRHMLPMVALVLSGTACSDPGGSQPPESDEGDETASSSMTSLSGIQVTPANAQQKQALEALEATEVMQVLTLLNGNLALNPLGLTLPAIPFQVLQNAQQALGASCVEVQPSPSSSPLQRTFSLVYTQCSGPLGQVTIDGTTTTTFEFDVGMQQFTVETTDDLMITRGGQTTPVMLNASGTLDVSGLVLHTQVDFTDFSGQPQSLGGVLDVAVDPATGCINASLAKGQAQAAVTLEVSDLSICQDGNVCVGSVSFEAGQGAIALGFDQGQLHFHISGPNLPKPIDADLPINIPSCVDLVDAIP